MAEKELPAEVAREGTGTGNGAGSGSGTRIGKRERDRVAAAMNIRNARVGGPGGTGRRGRVSARGSRGPERDLTVIPGPGGRCEGNTEPWTGGTVVL